MNDIFAIRDFSFPKDFLLGSATAGHQIEGNNINTGLWDYEIEQHNKNPEYELSGLACNSYEMYEEDIGLIEKLGHNIFRMSMEWARIEPEKDNFIISELEHYIKIFEMLKQRGVKIVLSVVHGPVPKWFNYDIKQMPDFEKYLNYVVPKISQHIDYWCIFNEFNFAIENFDFKERSIRFHARAYHVIKQYSNKPISTAHALRQHYAKRQTDKFDVALANYYDVCFNEFWFHAIRTGEIVFPGRDCFYDKEIKDTCDYWAINTYLRTMVDSRASNSEYGERYSFNKIYTIHDAKYDMTNEFNPECVIQNLLRLNDKPVLITENGMCTDQDEFRIAWILEYLSAVREVMDMGIDVIGYLYWSLLDNYEWGSYVPKFGLVSVDRENEFKRTIKPSAFFYKDIIDNKGYKREMLEKYLKHAPKAIF